MFLFSPWDSEKCNLDVFAYLVQVAKLKSEPLNHKVKREVTLKMVNVVVGAAADLLGISTHHNHLYGSNCSTKRKKIQCAAVVRRKLPCWCQGPEVIMGRLAGDHREATASRKTSQATMKRTGGKKLWMWKMHVLTPTFVSARHPLQVICKGRLSANQVRENADLRREDRSVVSVNLITVWRQRRHRARKIRAESSLFICTGSLVVWCCGLDNWTEGEFIWCGVAVSKQWRGRRQKHKHATIDNCLCFFFYNRHRLFRCSLCSFYFNI